MLKRTGYWEYINDRVKLVPYLLLWISEFPEWHSSRHEFDIISFYVVQFTYMSLK